jgi:hypothetical protein
VPKQSKDDPAIGKYMTMKDFISHFHSTSDDEVPIKFHTGDSNDVLRQVECSPELVFHDGMHTYQTVSTDINTIKHMSDQPPIQVFDDCYLFDDEWRYTPFSDDMWFQLDHIPKFREAIRKLRHFSISKSRYFGVNKAVKEELNRKEYNLAEFIMDNDHAPITVLRNRSS